MNHDQEINQKMDTKNGSEHQESDQVQRGLFHNEKPINKYIKLLNINAPNTKL
jgi:hypothetical protein